MFHLIRRACTGCYARFFVLMAAVVVGRGHRHGEFAQAPACQSHRTLKLTFRAALIDLIAERPRLCHELLLPRALRAGIANSHIQRHRAIRIDGGVINKDRPQITRVDVFVRIDSVTRNFGIADRDREIPPLRRYLICRLCLLRFYPPQVPARPAAPAANVPIFSSNTRLLFVLCQHWKLSKSPPGKPRTLLGKQR